MGEYPPEGIRMAWDPDYAMYLEEAEWRPVVEALSRRTGPPAASRRSKRRTPGEGRLRCT